MKRTLFKVIAFIRNPKYISYAHAPLKYKKKLFLQLLALSFLMAFALVSLMGLVFDSLLGLDLGRHQMENLLDEKPLYYIFLLAVVLAPVLEELIFRAGLSLFKGKTYFKWVFYLSSLLFALIHITNYEPRTLVYILAPILVLPQFILGLILGFIRVRLGLVWSILLHAGYNGLLFVPIMMAKLVGIDIE